MRDRRVQHRCTDVVLCRLLLPQTDQQINRPTGRGLTVASRDGRGERKGGGEGRGDIPVQSPHDPAPSSDSSSRTAHLGRDPRCVHSNKEINKRCGSVRSLPPKHKTFELAHVLPSPISLDSPSLRRSTAHLGLRRSRLLLPPAERSFFVQHNKPSSASAMAMSFSMVPFDPGTDIRVFQKNIILARA